mmetsp:Transcript_88755/g.275933  ORF Transcript_88755/g.275933 Transcript_88755/m.275933 type:complete len:212 (+) Transcript_88755:1124-1759(+)
MQYLRQAGEGGKTPGGGEDAAEGQARAGEVHVLLRALHGPRSQHEADGPRGERHRGQGAEAARQARLRDHRAGVPVRRDQAGARVPPRAQVDLRVRVLPGRGWPSREEPLRAPPEEPGGEDRQPARDAREGVRELLQRGVVGPRGEHAQQVHGIQDEGDEPHERDAEVPRPDHVGPELRWALDGERSSASRNRRLLQERASSHAGALTACA